MRIVALEDAASEIAELRHTQAVVFAGSGVSIWKPSTLPSGASVTKSIWDILFQDFPVSESEKGLLDTVVWEFPFEHLFEVCPNQEQAREMLVGIYHCGVANLVHDGIADGIDRGLVSSIITTNYDGCFEAALARLPVNSWRLISDENEASCIEKESADSFLFKVHGTAIPNSTSLIFTLRNEGLLPIGKRLLLQRLITNSTCIFIGYSGLDFDLCPLVAEFKNVRAIWLGREPKPSTVNARKVLEQLDGVYIRGDMLEFLGKWLGRTCSAELNTRTLTVAEIESVFSAGEIAMWRVAVLNALGLPRLALRAIDFGGSKIPPIGNLLHTARSLFFMGKYLQASACFAELARLEASRGDPKGSANTWFDVCDSYRAGGYFFRALLAIWRGRRIPGYDKPKYLLKKSRFLANLLYGLTVLNFPEFALKPGKRYLAHQLIQCMHGAIEQGSLHDFQDVGDIAQRLSIDLGQFGKDVYVPTPSQEGYKHLGYYHAEAMTFCDDCLRLDVSLLGEDEIRLYLDTFDRHIAFCSLTEQHPNTWKLLATKRTFLRRTAFTEFNEMVQLKEAFEACEYAQMMGGIQRRRFSWR